MGMNQAYRLHAVKQMHLIQLTAAQQIGDTDAVACYEVCACKPKGFQYLPGPSTVVDALNTDSFR